MNTTFLDRIIEPFAECLTPDAARKIVALKEDDATQRRVDDLADKYRKTRQYAELDFFPRVVV